MAELPAALVRQLMLRRKQQQLGAKESAMLVRAELLAAIEENRAPELDPSVVAEARKAAPYGAFPSHAVLLMCFESVL